MEQEPLEFFHKVRRGYLDLAVQQPDRIVPLNADQTPEALEEQIWKLVEDRRNAV